MPAELQLECQKVKLGASTPDPGSLVGAIGLLNKLDYDHKFITFYDEDGEKEPP